MISATIVFDNTTKNKQLKADWGFACVIEYHDRMLLFDTGADGNILLNNMKKLNINPQSIHSVFISHNHFDHIGGLSHFLNENSDVILYLPQSLRGVTHGREIIHIDDNPRELEKGIFTTGELEGIEQSLVISTSKGMVIFVGCSHPDMNKILSRAKQFGKLFGIIGGLHGFNHYKLFQDLQLICPTHCTKNKQVIKNIYPDKVIEGGVGLQIVISS